MKKLLLLALLVAFTSALVGCRNTAHGIGQDIENTGEKIQEKTR